MGRVTRNFIRKTYECAQTQVVPTIKQNDQIESMQFTGLNDAAIVDIAREALRQGSRVHIPNVLRTVDAHALHDALQSTDWRLVLNGDTGTYDFKASDVSAMNLTQQEKLLQIVHAKAGTGFQFLFDSHRISDEYDAGRVTTGTLADLYVMLNSAPVLAQLRAVTGEPRIAYVDAQATRYRPGHFLTEHDDALEGKDRLYAYVLNLTQDWHADWGGLLMFYNQSGHVAQAFTPAWNALNILQVPQAHAVSMVAPFARGFRYSITGWMRAARPTGP